MKLTATSLLAHIAHLLRRENHEKPLALPVPRNATAAMWERDPEWCEVHHAAKFRSFVETDTLKFGEQYCSQCELERHETTILHLQASKIKALFPLPGQLTRRIHMAEVRHALQERVISEITSKERTPHITTPLAARDITLASTPRATATPTPETRECLFADVPDVPHEEEIDEETTEKRRIVRKATDTVEIPAMNAEVILEALMHGKTHEQSTGENERLPIRVGNWML